MMKKYAGPEDRQATANYLEKKRPRTLSELAEFLRLRLNVDGTEPNAELAIVYSRNGPFQRVVAHGITGSDIASICALIEQAEKK